MTLQDEVLDNIVVCETRVPIDTPDVVGKDLAQSGFNVINQPSPLDRRGYGLAVIHRDIFDIKLVKLTYTPTTFEVMFVDIVDGTEHNVLQNRWVTL